MRSVNAHGTSHVTTDIAGDRARSAGRTGRLGGDVGGRRRHGTDLRWTAPGGAAPLGYIVEAGSEPGLSDIAKLQVTSLTEFSTEAPPGTYYVRVRALNERGAGPASNEILVQR